MFSSEDSQPELCSCQHEAIPAAGRIFTQPTSVAGFGFAATPDEAAGTASTLGSFRAPKRHFGPVTSRHFCCATQQPAPGMDDDIRSTGLFLSSPPPTSSARYVWRDATSLASSTCAWVISCSNGGKYNNKAQEASPRGSFQERMAFVRGLRAIPSLELQVQQYFLVTVRFVVRVGLLLARRLMRSCLFAPSDELAIMSRSSALSLLPSAAIRARIS